MLRTNNSSEPVEKIELLSIELLEQNRLLVEELKHLAVKLNLELGWHYLLDLTWIITNLGQVNNRQILDAGAGIGLMQWYLALQGAEVISVDRLDRSGLDMKFRSNFQVKGLRETDLSPVHSAIIKSFSKKVNGSSLRRWAVRSYDFIDNLLILPHRHNPSGRVMIYNQDLANMPEISDSSLDAVVAVSALEHNTKEGLKNVLEEIMRVLKPGGVLLATLCGAHDQDWWHEPSSGWCFTENTLRSMFDLPSKSPSNFTSYDELFASLRNCAELRDNLAKFYFKSDKNGMPWGKWNPQYQPVGVCKRKINNPERHINYEQ